MGKMPEMLVPKACVADRQPWTLTIGSRDLKSIFMVPRSWLSFARRFESSLQGL
jgi:hypothetical protein